MISAAVILCGGSGCIAGISNLYPDLTSGWVKALRDGDFAKGQEYQQKIDKEIQERNYIHINRHISTPYIGVLRFPV